MTRRTASDDYFGPYGSTKAKSGWCICNQHDRCIYPGCTCDCHGGKPPTGKTEIITRPLLSLEVLARRAAEGRDQPAKKQREHIDLTNLTELTCKVCAATKPVDAFHKAPGTRTGRDSTCKECRKARRKKG